MIRHSSTVTPPPVGEPTATYELEWCGLQPGDRVFALGRPACTYRFVRYVAPADGKKPYVEVRGGRRGQDAFAALHLDKVLNKRRQPVLELFTNGIADPVPLEKAPKIVDTEDV